MQLQNTVIELERQKDLYQATINDINDAITALKRLNHQPKPMPGKNKGGRPRKVVDATPLLKANKHIPAPTKEELAIIKRREYQRRWLAKRKLSAQKTITINKDKEQ